MNASSSASVSTVIANSFKNEGMTWLFRGWTPAWIRLSPNTIIILCVFSLATLDVASTGADLNDLRRVA
jgi:dicarboxylate transporter 10